MSGCGGYRVRFTVRSVNRRTGINPECGKRKVEINKMANRDEYNAAFQTVRPKILARDRNCCVKCKSTLSLEVHHIEGYTHNEPELLATLCYLCHGVAPMGKEHFEQWLVIGETGVDILKKRMAAAGLSKMNCADIEKFCGVLIKFGYETSNLKLKTARDRLEKAGLITYGRKPYGARPGEAEILQKMIELGSCGKSSEFVARELNIAGLSTRYGKPWHTSTVAKILTKEGVIKPKPRLEVIPKQPKKRGRPRKTVKQEDNGGVWVPVMMHGAEMRQVENIQKSA